MRVFTFIVNHHGSTVYSQAAAPDAATAVAAFWAAQPVAAEDVDPLPAPVAGLHGVWCDSAVGLDGSFWLLHVVESALPRRAAVAAPGNTPQTPGAKPAANPAAPR
ncbi:MAG: hypothetical protein AAF677_03465 [Pseudomonadota bacterium]